jgi:hypothetical protein
MDFFGGIMTVGSSTLKNQYKVQFSRDDRCQAWGAYKLLILSFLHFTTPSARQAISVFTTPQAWQAFCGLKDVTGSEVDLSP